VFIAPTALPEDPATLQQIPRAALAEIERLRLLIAGLLQMGFPHRDTRVTTFCTYPEPRPDSPETGHSLRARARR
jgi:hypothetical protein